MKILVWNCMGCNNDPTVRQLWSLMNLKSLDNYFISKTKANEDHVLRINSLLGYHSCFVVPANNKAGDLALFWNHDVMLDIISHRNHTLKTRCTMDPKRPNRKQLFSMVALTMFSTRPAKTDSGIPK